MRHRRTPEGYRPVDEYTEKQLHSMLVQDAVKHHATFLPWAVKAYERIGRLNGRGADAAYQAVLDEVESLTGIRALPLASAATAAELKAFGL